MASVAGGHVADVLVPSASILAWDWSLIPPPNNVMIASNRDVLAVADVLVVALRIGELVMVAHRRAYDAPRLARG